MVTGLYAGVAAVFLVFLSIRIIGLRRGKKISVGPAGDPDLERAMRVQANFVEYTPLFIVMLAIAELNGLPVAIVHVFGSLFLLARLSHFAGFRSESAPGRLRVFGMAGTFILLLSAAAVNVSQVLTALV